MLLDDVAQLWGLRAGMLRLTPGCTPEQARTIVGGSLLTGDLRFTLGLPAEPSKPAPLHGVVRPWGDIELLATQRSDIDGSFWTNAQCVAEYVASEVGKTQPRASVGAGGERKLALRVEGRVDGVLARVRVNVEGLTELGTSMELTLAPQRRWDEVVGDALGVGSAFGDLVNSPDAGGLAPGGTRSLANELDGVHLEVHHALDGALRLRVSVGKPHDQARAPASVAVASVQELLVRHCARVVRAEEPGMQRAVYRGLGEKNSLRDVTVTVTPGKSPIAELLVAARGE